MEEKNYWQRLARKKVSRRTLLTGGATTALGGAAALMVGCNGGGGGEPVVTSDPNRTPGPGGSVTWGRPVAVGGVDPHLDLTGLDIGTLCYPYLYSWAPGREELVFNNLALSLEMPSVTEFIFTLREGVKNSSLLPEFADEDIDSEAVRQSFIRRGTSITAPDKRFPHKIAGSTDPAMLPPALITPDKYTFTFTMSDPFVPAVREMANATWAMLSPSVCEHAPRLVLSRGTYGAGPFHVTEFNGNERIVLVKNPDFWIEDRPYLDGITYVIITDNSSLLAAFKNGQHDISGAVLTKEDFDEFSTNPAVSVARAPSLFYPVVHMKMRKAPFDDIRVREAMNISINRDLIIELAQSGEGQYGGPIQWPQVKWALPEARLKEFYQLNIPRAQELMADAGYSGGFSSIMKVPRLPGINVLNDIAQIIVDSWREINIEVQIDELELGSYIGTLLSGNFDLTFFPNLPYDEPDRPLAFYHSAGVTGTGNWTGYTNPELDELINAQSQEFDEDKRKEIITEAQEMILPEHGPQLTTVGGYAYQARQAYVHYPYTIGEDPSEDALPWGSDLWTELS
ncbi:MAG TPA: ABC transporter substrate-binding protein [Dehalococcoidia bacterium]|nr:ABC transporter substrate-binding protein [Dehalococcoidia bacterium]